MKKIFRMALVFALAGATLMYTGCTKDYGEDIDALSSDVEKLRDDLTNKVNDLSSEVSNLRSAVNSLQSAVTAAETTLGTHTTDISSLKTRVTNLETAVANCATKEQLEALKTEVATLKTDILAVTDGLQSQLDTLKGSVDANTAAIGEMMYGVARGMKDFIVLTLGTGVGSGIVVDGKLVYGSNGFAGELGHVATQRHEGRACGCGRNDCLETYCSATGVARTAREMLQADARPSILRGLNPEEITSLDVSLAAGQGDALALEIYELTGRMLGEACADFAVFSAPEAFIFFGGMTKAGELLMRPIRESYVEHVHPLFREAKFLISGLNGSSADVLGASAVGWGYSSLFKI